MRPIPINMAEAVIDPLWDPQLSELERWHVEPGPEHGLRLYQNWCWAGFEWARRPASGPALHMARHYDVDCSGYDHLIISVMAPDRSVLRVRATTERGVCAFEAPPAPSVKKEYALDLGGAARLIKLTIEIDASDNGIANGWINWIGLQNATLMPRLLGQWERFDARWEGYLKPESYAPGFEPTYGILIDAHELAAFRAEHDAFLAQHGASPYTIAAEAAARLVPEQMIHDYVNFWGDTRYCRERDYSHLLLRHGPNAAIAGLLLKDKELLRLAARYALALAMCEHWDDGFICAFPGGNFEHRCFVQSLCVHETALILDLAGELFTDLGREYILRRIVEEGLGSINFNTWQHEYIFHCNQLAWFTPGRMLGYLTLERAGMPRARPYTELAYADLVESLGHTILPDGGYVEGPTYFRCVARDGGLSLYYYARGRGLPYRAVIPDVVARTASFGAAVISTDDSADVIPICDARPLMEQEGVAVMASLLPASAWVSMFHKSVARGGMPETVLAWQASRDIPRADPALPGLVSLPEMGILASHRQLDGETVKLFIMGNKAGAGHTHEDKGSFVLEFAGDTFAMDPGTCDYGNPLSFTLKHCQRHNMLVPPGMSERPRPANPIPADVKPQGTGDEVRFGATIDATPGWEDYYRRWVRTWDAPAPDTLAIRDEYELANGDAVECYWNTRLPVEVRGRMVTLMGRRGQVVLEAPAGCVTRVDELPLLDGEVQRRIVFRKEGTAGSLEVRARLSVR